MEATKRVLDGDSHEHNAIRRIVPDKSYHPGRDRVAEVLSTFSFIARS